MPPLRRVDLWLPPLVLMAAIFFFSAQPSLDSGFGWIDSVGRKLVHFAEYALLSFLVWRALAHGLPNRRAALAGLVVASLYAASDELHQSFVEGRRGTPVDWAIDTAGAALVAWRLAARGQIAA